MPSSRASERWGQDAGSLRPAVEHAKRDLCLCLALRIGKSRGWQRLVFQQGAET